MNVLTVKEKKGIAEESRERERVPTSKAKKFLLE